MHGRYVIPLFQRPYVWTKDDQWAPLWLDVVAVAENVLSAPPAFGESPVPPHFLGAIVVEAHQFDSGYIAVRHVVDGQQRLTTLQLLLDAAQLVMQKYGNPLDAAAMKQLIHNDAAVVQNSTEVFKVWPTDRDQAAFAAAMDDDATLSPELARAPIAQAHTFFVDSATKWALSEGEEAAPERLHALAQALHSHLRLVVIDLEPQDNAQVIFETLNHRGVDLLAADLIKNLVFQYAESQDLSLSDLYQEHWKALDSDTWRSKVSQGRLYRPKIDLFFQHWLTMRLRKAVPVDRVFAVFRDDVVKAERPPALELVKTLVRDAAVYDSFASLPQTSVEGLFYYRVVRALDSSVVLPFFLWIQRQADVMPVDQRHRALRAVESWLVRRALLRATPKDVNTAIVELLRHLNAEGAQPARAGDITQAFLAGQSADSRYWPDDLAVTRTIATQPLYATLTRPRLRMLLEALEDSLRSPYGEGTPCPRELTVEHLLPQGWREYWGGDLEGDLAAEIQRDRFVHVLGNLTLVSGKLNPAMSNRPWTDADATAHDAGSTGKRTWLQGHSELKLNAALLRHESGWTEPDIADRTARLTEALLAIWPRPTTDSTSEGKVPEEIEEPATPTGITSDPILAEEDGLPGHRGKYRALWRWLSDQNLDEVTLTFDQVEGILDMPLPPSARSHLPHWYGYEGTALGRAIRDAGWKASGVNLSAERVTFVRDIGEN